MLQTPDGTVLRLDEPIDVMFHYDRMGCTKLSIKAPRAIRILRKEVQEKLRG